MTDINDIIYASVYDKHGDLRCIIHANLEVSVGCILDLLHQVYEFDNLTIGDKLEDAEAETLIEMKVCDLVNIRLIWDEGRGWRKDGVGWTLQKA